MSAGFDSHNTKNTDRAGEDEGQEFCKKIQISVSQVDQNKANLLMARNKKSMQKPSVDLKKALTADAKRSPRVKQIYSHVQQNQELTLSRPNQAKAHPGNMHGTLTPQDIGQRQYMQHQVTNMKSQAHLNQHTNQFTQHNYLLSDMLNEFGHNTNRPVFSAGSPDARLSGTFGGSLNPRSIPTDNASIQQHFDNNNYMFSENDSIIQNSFLAGNINQHQSGIQPTGLNGQACAASINALSNTQSLHQSNYKTCKSQRQKYRQKLKETGFESKNTAMLSRFDKFCRLVGQGFEANQLKMQFAKQLGVPRMLHLKDQHKQIIDQNIRPEFQVVKDAYVNPKHTEPRSASQLFEKLQEAKSIKTMHQRNLSQNTTGMYSQQFDISKNRNYNVKSGNFLHINDPAHISFAAQCPSQQLSKQDQEYSYVPSEYLGGEHVTPRYNDLNQDIKFFDKRFDCQKVPYNESVKTSHMRDHINK